MTLHRQLLTSKKNIININSDDTIIKEHFANSNNYADVVLNMFNTDRFYDPYFQGWDNLNILDIGGNIGLFSLYIQDRARSVYTLEPTPEHFYILKSLTKDYSNIHPMNVALHNCDEDISFYISTENSTMNSTVNQYGKKISVKGLTLSSLLTHLNLDTVDFIKCDIEGSEMMAITEETLKPVANRIKVWSMEVHATDNSLPWAVSLNKNRNYIADIFRNCGYNVYIQRHDCLYAYKL